MSNYLEDLKKKVSKEKLEDLYCNQLLGKMKCAEALGIKYNAVINLIKEYNLVQDTHAAKSKSNKEVKNREYNKIKERISKEILYNYYIIGDHTYEETYKHFGLSEWVFDRLLKEYSINKDKKLSCLKGLQTKYKKAGSKEEYFKNLDKNRKINIIDKYGSLDAYYQQVVDKMQETIYNKYKVVNTSALREIAIKRSETRAKCKSFDGTSFDSNWEKDIYEYCLRNNIPIKKGPSIKFKYNNKTYSTSIDFEIDGVLMEVKGSHLLSGCFDYRKYAIPITEKLKVYRENNVILITNSASKNLFKDSNGLRYDKQALVGVDISLFQNPKFPYRIDRPECFYKVRVNNQLSCFEAFNDEKLRWKMIKNRIKYVGGFIDNKSILTAMNVTRICKQPSWFSKEFAKNIIKKYVTTNIIIDPFAGWGMRCDAAKELGVKYLGVDLNEELVKWHQELNRNIILGDAINFSSDQECSVFICPPYQDKEIYFENQNCNLTQCDWLKIVMKNISNAKEYIMVCKVVDTGWEKYIKEIKINKSHFGENKEYVLVLSQNERQNII